MIRESYYPMKRRLGGEKWTVHDKLCFHWYPTPGCIMHGDIIGERRAGILFERYCGMRNSKANLLYWRTHPKEWIEILRRTARKQ